jgi:glycosyltransferase involved in cell wall biosynthesis
MHQHTNTFTEDLVTVIITCYNHGKYLTEAIQSVHSQQNVNVEIVVVDDGSTDDTREVVKRHPDVKYVYQKNQGLSAARNTGIENSTGTYLVFLDADDWILDDALATNLQYLKRDENFVFVSGTYQYFFEKIGRAYDIIREVRDHHYEQFLRCNYIGMHAAVMYRRWAFDFYKFDTTLKASEDYDMFLHLSRKFPVYHHTQPIAVYRIHGNNMSGNIPMMLEYTLKVLNRQKSFLRNENETIAFTKGIQGWKQWYTSELYKKLYPMPIFTNSNAKADLNFLWKFDKYLLFKYLVRQNIKLAKWTSMKILPPFLLWYKKRSSKNSVPAIGKVNKGDFNRTSPFSYEFGYDRGGPIDRYYIERFLLTNASSIKGRVLEIGDNSYTKQFGGSYVQQSDVLNIYESPNATFVGDLSDGSQLPDQAFDCIILTQTLQVIYDYKSAIKTCFRILKPNGTLLLTVPGISHIDHDEWKDYWLWSFTKKSIERLLSEVFETDNVKVHSYGNVLVASSFLYGMGVTELTNNQLEYYDPHYQLVISAKAKKQSQ